MATFVRIRRLHRTPLRIGRVNVSNGRTGSLIDLDDAATRRDLKNSYDRWVFVDRALNNAVAVNATQTVNNIPVTDIVTDQAANANFIGTGTGGTEYAAAVHLPAGFTVSTITLLTGATGATGTTSHGWATVATYDGSTNLTYQAVSADLTSGTIAANAAVSFSPVVSGTTKYVTPYEGQYIVTFTLVVGTTVPSFVGATTATATAASQLAGPIPQNLSNYGNVVTNALVNPWYVASGGTGKTTPPAVASTNAASNFTARAFIPYIRVS